MSGHDVLLKVFEDHYPITEEASGIAFAKAAVEAQFHAIVGPAILQYIGPDTDELLIRRIHDSVRRSILENKVTQ